MESLYTSVLGEKLSLDLVKLLEKGSAQLAEVQSLPEGYVCFALEDSSTEEEQQPPVSQQVSVSLTRVRLLFFIFVPARLEGPDC